MTRKISLSYFAGLIDADGTIAIARNKYYEERFGGFYGIVYLSLTNSDGRLISDVLEQFGGSLDQVYHAAYQWRIYGRPAVDIIKKILPYLRIKREEANVAIEFQSLLLKSGKRMTEANKRKRIELWTRSGELKRTRFSRHPMLVKRISIRR